VLKLNMKSKVMRSFIVFLLAFSLLTSGCYGSFALTRKLHEFNGTIQDRFARSLVTAGLVLIVYYWTGLGDWIIFNTIEFWTGKNPISEEVINVPAKGKKKSSLGEDLYVQTLHRTDSGLETKIDSYREGSLVRSLTLHFQEGSPVVTADLRWAGTGVSEHYTAEPLSDGRMLLVHVSSTGEKMTTLIEAEEIQKVTSKLASFLPHKTASEMLAKAVVR